MKDFLKRKLFNFRNDWILWGASLLAILFIPFHIYQFIDSSFQIEPLFRIVFYSVSPFIVFLVGEKAIPILICIFSILIEQLSKRVAKLFLLLRLIIIVLQ